MNLINNFCFKSILKKIKFFLFFSLILNFFMLSNYYMLILKIIFLKIYILFSY